MNSHRTRKIKKELEKLEVAVSDLTYAKVGSKWNYIRTIIELYNREITGYSAGIKKNAELIETTLLRCHYSLKTIKIFHSDRGNEYDNSVSEATNKILKMEFIYQRKFKTLG